MNSGCQAVGFSSDSVSEVSSIHEGKVISHVCIGDIQAIIVEYGDFAICYTDMTDVVVVKGEYILKGQVLGKFIPTDRNNNSMEIGIFNGKNHVENSKEWFDNILANKLKL